MAFIFKDWRPNISRRMNPSRTMQKWFTVAHYAKTSNGYWVAWHDDLEKIALLPPDHPENEECRWLESWDSNDTIESFFEYVESGDCEKSDGMVLNIFIQNPETGVWE